jgi:3-oxoacyl-[acyl-carrier protein] reductase
MQLDGKVSLVTGGGTGLGRAITLALAKAGSHVAINYCKSAEEAEATAHEARSLGVKALTVKADVAHPKDVSEMVGRIRDEFDRVDILINNAGTTRYVPIRKLQDVKSEDWDRIMAVNLKGMFLCAQAVAEQMIKNGYGKIVNTASNSGLRPAGSSIPYIVSKAGVLMLTKCLATALHPQVQVNAIAPGFMDTRWVTEFVPEAERAEFMEGSDPAAVDLEEMGRTVIWIVSTKALTGQTIVMDPGKTML